MARQPSVTSDRRLSVVAVLHRTSMDLPVSSHPSRKDANSLSRSLRALTWGSAARRRLWTGARLLGALERRTRLFAVARNEWIALSSSYSDYCLDLFVGYFARNWIIALIAVLGAGLIILWQAVVCPACFLVL